MPTDTHPVPPTDAILNWIASKLKGSTMTGFSVKPLNETTWPDFARLVERHNGVWGGCWCMAFHPEGVGPPGPRRRTELRKNVEFGKAELTPPSYTTA